MENVKTGDTKTLWKAILVSVPIIIISFVFVKSFIGYAFIDYEAQWNAINGKIIETQMEIEAKEKQKEAYENDKCEIESLWCTEKLNNNRANMTEEEITNCLKKERNQCITSPPEMAVITDNGVEVVKMEVDSLEAETIDFQ